VDERKRVRCQLVLDAKGKLLIRCKNPAKHDLPDGTPLMPSALANVCGGDPTLPLQQQEEVL
jgi:hypothetical protein